MREWFEAYIERVRQQFELAGQSPEWQRLAAEFQSMLRTALILLVLLLIGGSLLALRAFLRPAAVRPPSVEPGLNGHLDRLRRGQGAHVIDNLLTGAFLLLGLIAVLVILGQTGAFLLRR
jgi:hypothetical protein